MGKYYFTSFSFNMQSAVMLYLFGALLAITCVAKGIPEKTRDGDVKPGHNIVKEYHMHPYWFQTNKQQEAEALRLRAAIIAEVKSGNMTVVCNGITRDILPKLDDTKVPGFNTHPLGPHPCGSFEVWIPREYLPNMMSFMMYHRGNLSVLFHPLGKTEMDDHTRDAMWLGPSFPIDLHVLDTQGGDDPQYTELGLGYSAVEN